MSANSTDHSLVGRVAGPLPCGCTHTLECLPWGEACDVFVAAIDAREGRDMFGNPDGTSRLVVAGEAVLLAGLFGVERRGTSLACESLRLSDNKTAWHVKSLCEACRADLERRRKALESGGGFVKKLLITLNLTDDRAARLLTEDEEDLSAGALHNAFSTLARRAGLYGQVADVERPAVGSWKIQDSLGNVVLEARLE